MKPETPWPQALAEQMLAWAQTLDPSLGGVVAETLLRCVSQLETARTEGHVLLPLSTVDAARLRACAVVEDAADENFPRGLPLVLDGGRLYLHRDHEHEVALAARIAALRLAAVREVSPQPLRSLFPAPVEGEIDWQALAVAQALRQRLTLISGGPGTGKTSSVLKLLACVLAAEPEARIRLAAPTGKAAQRMLEALRSGSAELAERLEPALAERLLAALPQEALTLHRLLGAGPQGWRFGADQALELDWLIVDEASMLDLGLARQLLDALPPQGRLVLLGDRHQLAAVENGAVLAELSREPSWSEPCRAALQQALGLASLDLPTDATKAGLPDLAVQFQRSHRFAANSGIGRLAARVREGDGDAAWALLQAGAPDLQGLAPDAALQPLLGQGLGAYASALRALAAAPDDLLAEDTVWRAWEGFRVLCAGHAGPLGTRTLNASAAAWLATQLPAAAPASLGQPLLVTRNQGDLINGDVLLLLPSPAGGLQAVLRRGDTRLRLPLERLPEDLEGAFAMTVHKAQGSEFERVLLLLPELEWLSREWLYTGITRARRHLTLLGSEAALQAIVARPTERRSGLAAAILAATPALGEAPA